MEQLIDRLGIRRVTIKHISDPRIDPWCAEVVLQSSVVGSGYGRTVEDAVTMAVEHARMRLSLLQP